jgi:hypothetical protein
MNKVNSIKKIALAASILLAAVLAFFCSSDGEEANEPSSSSAELSSSSSSSYSSSSSLLYSSSSSIGETTGDSSSSSSGNGQGGGSSSSSSGGRDNRITEVYALTAKTNDSFTYKIEGSYSCKKGGVLYKESDDLRNRSYSIINNAMVWKYPWSDDDRDSLNFIGTSDNLIGTWARTKNLDAYCRREACKYDFNIIETTFTEDSLRIIRDYCLSDEVQKYGSEFAVNGWTTQIINCDTYELHKGTEIITVQGTLSRISFTYNDKTCIGSVKGDHSVSELENACAAAWAEFQAENEDADDFEIYYGDFLFNTPDECNTITELLN